MTGSIISIIVLTVSFALFAFVIAFLISSIVSADKIAADKRLEELKKKEGDNIDVALVNHESRHSKRKKENKVKNSFFEKLASDLYKELQSADIKMRPEEFLTIWLLIAILPASLVVMILGNSTVAIVLLVLGLVVPMFIVRQKQKSRVKKFDSQLSDALMTACSCLRSGLTFTQAMETIAKDMPDPISSEFSLAVAEMSMGSSMEEALDHMGTRIKSQYLALTISAVLIQRQTGGNLSKILDNISASIKEKMKLKQELKSATASGKMTGLVVGCMPVILIVLFLVVNKDFMLPLFTTSTGHIFLGVAAGLELICFVVVKKILAVKM
jgi:tight adherence protein B